ncbi:MAG: hypothetical protein K6T83_01070 [Alicyclobacillus sp.]|nr:hypothetical protein [Alicyclobacillus sp.]
MRSQFEDLLSYLRELRELQHQGINCYGETKEVLQAINRELGLAVYMRKPISIADHLEHHPLIAWDDTRKEPVIANSKRDFGSHGNANISVREILQHLAQGATVHQLCGKYDLDINQVSGAVIFAAYVVADAKYEPEDDIVRTEGCN